VDAQHVTPSQKNLERNKREKEEVRRIYSSSSDTRRWYGSFNKTTCKRYHQPLWNSAVV